MKVLSKILIPVTALLVIASLLFLPLLRISLDSSIISNESLGIGEYNSVVGLIEVASDENSQLASYIKLIKQYSENNSESNIKDFIPTIDWLYASIAMLALILLFVLLIVIFGLFSKKHMFTAGFAAGGMLSTVLMNTFFDKFAAPLLNGTVNVSTLLQNINSGATANSGNSVNLSGALSSLSDALSEALGFDLSNLANSLVKINALELSFANTGVLLAFGAIIVLAIVFTVSIKNENSGKLPG